MKITEAQLRARYKKWTDALRSGKYKQGRGRLKDVDGYCCLGVLVDLGDNVKRTDKEWVSCDQPVPYARAYPPDHILEAMGLQLGLDYSKLAILNDRGKSFKEIADYIENVVMPNVMSLLEDRLG